MNHEHDEFILDVLDKVKSGALEPQQALMSIISLLVTVQRESEREATKALSYEFGSDLLTLSQKMLGINEPGVTTLFRDWLLEKANKATDSPQSSDGSERTTDPKAEASSGGTHA